MDVSTMAQDAFARVWNNLAWDPDDTTGGARTEYRGRMVDYCAEVLGIVLWGKEHSPIGCDGQVEWANALDDPEVSEVWISGGRGSTKTMFFALAVIYFEDTRENSVGLTTASTQAQVKNQVWREMRGVEGRADLPGEMLTQEWHIGPTWYAIGLSTDNPDSLRGYRGKGGTIGVIDEGTMVADENYEAIEGSMTIGETKLLVGSNPTRRGCRFHRGMTGDEEKGVRRFVCPATGPPRVDGWGGPGTVALMKQEFLDAKLARYGKDHPFYQAYIASTFPTSGDDVVGPWWLLERNAGQAAMGLFEKRGPKTMGVDISGQGRDSCVAMLNDGGLVTGRHEWNVGKAVRKTELMETAAVIARIGRAWKVDPRFCAIDNGGLGAGVASQLRRIWGPIQAVDFGGGVKNDFRHLIGDVVILNRRAELHWACRRLLDEGTLAVPVGTKKDATKYERLWDELSGIPFERQDQTDKLKVMGKKELKKLLGRSPDDTDALLLTLAARSGRATVPLVGKSGTRK